MKIGGGKGHGDRKLGVTETEQCGWVRWGHTECWWSTSWERCTLAVTFRMFIINLSKLFPSTEHAHNLNLARLAGKLMCWLSTTSYHSQRSAWKDGRAETAGHSHTAGPPSSPTPDSSPGRLIMWGDKPRILQVTFRWVFHNWRPKPTKVEDVEKI